jgi:hypothetical protein
LLALTYLKNDRPRFRAVERKYREFWLLVLIQGKQAVVARYFDLSQSSQRIAS